MNNDTDSAYEDAVARGNMYRFLAAIYLQPPTQDLVLNIIDVEFLKELSLLFSESSVADLGNYAKSIDLEKDLALIKQDYMGLFAVPTGRYVTPFEDVYRGTRTDGNQESGPLLGVQAIAVKIMYRMAGAEMERTCKELPTHIGVELGFMNFLCEKEAAALKHARELVREKVSPDKETDTESEISNCRQLQSRFLHAHLNDWFPQLNQVIQEKAKTHFYRALAQVTGEFVAQDTANHTTQVSVEKPVQVHWRNSAAPQPG